MLMFSSMQSKANCFIHSWTFNTKKHIIPCVSSFHEKGFKFKHWHDSCFFIRDIWEMRNTVVYSLNFKYIRRIEASSSRNSASYIFRSSQILNIRSTLLRIEGSLPEHRKYKIMLILHNSSKFTQSQMSLKSLKSCTFANFINQYIQLYVYILNVANWIQKKIHQV